VKIVTKPIVPFQEHIFFSPLRDKINYAQLLIYSARNLLIDYEIDGLKITSNMKLIVDKMSRLFFYKEKKYFSVSFPFSVIVEEDKVTEISTYSGRTVDSKSISNVISILEDKQFALNPSPIDYYIESNTVESTGLALLEEIFQFEPAYIRYDFDATNENGKLHPLHHVDVNYSTYGTFKLGLNNFIVDTFFENILNINTDCSFLTD